MTGYTYEHMATKAINLALEGNNVLVVTKDPIKFEGYISHAYEKYSTFSRTYHFQGDGMLQVNRPIEDDEDLVMTIQCKQLHHVFIMPDCDGSFRQALIYNCRLRSTKPPSEPFGVFLPFGKLVVEYLDY